MAAFTNTKYESEEGDIHSLRLTPAYAAVAGTEPQGNVTNKIPAKVTKGNREFGLRPRGVRLFRTLGTGEDTFKRYAFLPLRSEADDDLPAYQEGATVTIGTVVWTVGAFVAEDYR